MYHKDKEADFTIWHDAVKILENIPAEGKVNNAGGVPVPDRQRTMSYSKWVQHSDESDNGVYRYGDHVDLAKTSYTRDELKALGWFPPEPEEE